MYPPPSPSVMPISARASRSPPPQPEPEPAPPPHHAASPAASATASITARRARARAPLARTAKNSRRPPGRGVMTAPARGCLIVADRSGLCQPLVLEPALRVERRHATRARRGHRLAVHRVRDVARREHARQVGARRARRHGEVALLVHVELPLED